MKKKWIMWVLTLCMIFSMMPLQALANGGQLTPAEKYQEYLLGGGYAEIMDRVPAKKELGVRSVLADVDGDGVQEALVQLSDKSWMGPRGYQTYSVVLDLENDRVVTRLDCYYGGGTMGGDTLELKYDNWQEKYVVILDSTIRDGVNAGAWLQHLYNNRYEVALSVEYNYIDLNASWYQERVNKVKSETSLYEITDYDQLAYWTVDGSYVNRATYQAQRDRFTNPDEDSPYAMYEGSYAKPIRIKTVPTWYNFKEDSFSFGNSGVSTISKKYFTTLYEDATGKLLYKEFKKMADGGICFGMAYTTASIHWDLPGVEQFMDEKLFGDDVTYDNVRQLEKDSYFYLPDDNFIGAQKIKLIDLLKYNHIYQLSSAVAASSEATWNDVDGLIELVQGYLNADRVGVTIGMTHVQMDANGEPKRDSEGDLITSGHRVLAVGVEGNDILIDDPNNTSDFERLTINDDGSWSYSGAWESDGVNSENSLIRYQTDVTVPYVLIASGMTTTSDEGEETDETYVEGMTQVDGDKILLAVNCEDYTVDRSVLPIFVDGGPAALESDLYWVSADGITVSDIGGGEICLAGNDDLLTVGAAKDSDVTLSVSDVYTGVLLKSKAGEACSICLESTGSDGADVALTVSGTVEDGKAVFARTDSGVSYSGLSDVTVTLTKDGEEENSRSVADSDSVSVLVDYDRDGGDDAIEVSGDDRPTNPFSDVERGRYYYDHVLWAVDEAITNGMTDTTFAPDSTCTRAQVVTFLWRAMGQPEPKSTNNPFTDVKEGQFHYKAVLWAVENGITNGMKADYFGSAESCTRGQVATFLWRALGKPGAETTKHPFTDLDKTRFYYDSVLWAVENNITTGMTATTFAPENPCTRGQIVTFLHRAMDQQ